MDAAPLRALPRTRDPRPLNAVANSPAVRPGLGMGEAPIDLSAAITDPGNLAFADERGGFFVERLEAGRYELHSLLGPSARGAAALRLVAHVIRDVFIETDALDLLARTPGNLRHADLMARRAGFRDVWTRPRSWRGPAGEVTSLRTFAISLDEWMQRDGVLVAEGETFADLLRSSPSDDGHARALGMAALMMKAGNARKAAVVYGRWARLAVMQPLAVLSEHPIIFAVEGRLVQARSGQLEILSCPHP